jgi:single-strand DNA-binding protein
MKGYNRIILGGRLTRDPELKEVSGNTLAKFGLAMNHRYTAKGGEKREEVTFIDCESWGKTAEMIGQYFSKGSAILVEGKLRLNEWTDGDGNKRSILVGVVERFEFVETKGEGGGTKSPEFKRSKPSNPSGGHIDAADIPFSPQDPMRCP